MKKIRCAIYTRKSSEEGLEQDFNSLHAQREACAAYVLSQASEGWSLLPGDYDDGGISGGTLERPALKRLLADIVDGKIDIVVVYKVDRLTRSLLDFSKLVEAFDKAETSFVSVTQSFNTTTSMGRLTLNMLLSFAQFEREVTAERIRDKIAASKARGMWMGGTPPLGYRPDGRTLAIVEADAVVVRNIFARYLDLGNVRLLYHALIEDGVGVPKRQASTGRLMGGCAFTRGQLYKILSNPIYLGEIHHQGRAYKGLHAPLIERNVWDGARARLSENLQGDRAANIVKSPSLLAGLIIDEAGKPLVATHACKGKVRYRYYVSRALQHDPDATLTCGMRIPARELEAAVVERLAEALGDPLALLASAAIAPAPDQVRAVIERADKLAAAVRAKNSPLIRKLVARVRATPQEVGIEIAAAELAKGLALNFPDASHPIVALSSSVRLTRTGRAVRLIHANGRAATAGTPDPGLIMLLLKAREWWALLASGEHDIATIAKRESINDSWLSRVIRLNFLAPGIVESILAGAQPAMLSSARLRNADFPIEWERQLAAFS
ncbi:MAG: recombinase family protein [Croceibacterium sp.]